MLAAFAAFAVVGFAAAYVGPTGVALAGASADEPAAVSLYSSAMSDSQQFAAGYAAGQAAAAVDLERGNYEVYVTPKPTPTPEPSASSSSSGSGSDSGNGGAQASIPLYTGGGSSADWMTAAGIAQSDWGYVDYIVSHESGWNPNATNSSSGACGLVQALPCSKVPGNGYDPVDNLRWGTGYAVGRYGSWAGAYSFWISNNWW
ncbi:transglycosylase SLT domain-containing protein [Microbacterium rhizomatis]|uniref:aggregation-promoting factor C-terminal-like domain-containing protein n=1 Tax=Microbacterium rhizomatis TaxID=1631477 RepID=UPI001FE7B707|nr:transglycosylase SLT domain-containing protein [Microbacterium rhizomatis]